MPIVLEVASGSFKELSIFGKDYETIDGTGVRDYVHVVDLAKSHLLAISANKINLNPFEIFIGCGKGVSVLQLVKAFEEVSL